MFEFPSELTSSLDALAHGRSRRDVAARAEAISQHYRSGTGSAAALRTADDALAYALTRMPATYAAIAAVLAGLRVGRAPRPGRPSRSSANSTRSG